MQEHPPLLFTTRGHKALGQAVSAELNIPLGEIMLKDFANNEIYVRYMQSIRGHPVYILAGLGPDPSRSLMETLIMVQAARLASAQSIIVIFPHYPYSRQDKKSTGREPITARLVAQMLEVAGASRVVTVDLHAGQIQGFFTIPCDHMTAMPVLIDHFVDWGGKDTVVVAPDAGRAKLARRWANLLGSDLAVLNKVRPDHNQAEVLSLIGNVEGKRALLIDDMIDTAGTLCSAAQALVDSGASSVIAAATHAVLSDPARELIEASVLEKVVVTDTLPVQSEGKIFVCSSAPLFAQTVRAVHEGGSVSQIFGGANFAF